MKPIYNLTDINNFKITKEQKEFIINTNFTKKELMNHLKMLKKAYFKTCTPIGYL